MKRLFLSLIGCLFLSILLANPIYLPTIYLHDFSFDEKSDWRMGFIILDPPDSMLICSSTSKAVFTVGKDFSRNPILTRDSLNANFTLDAEGDSITIISYFSHNNSIPDSLVETIIFGNYRGALLPRPLEGQYIGRICERIMGTDYHSVFDSLGISTGTVYGKVYNKENKLLTSGYFCFDPIPISLYCREGGFSENGFEVSSNGTFSTSVNSLVYSFDKLVSCNKNVMASCVSYSEKDSLSVNPTQFILFPESSIEINIHLLDDYVTLNTIKLPPPIIFNLFPNSVGTNELHYEITLPVRSTRCSFQLFNINGQRLNTYQITDNQGILSLPAALANGKYFIQLWVNGNELETKQFILNR